LTGVEVQVQAVRKGEVGGVVAEVQRMPGERGHETVKLVEVVLEAGMEWIRERQVVELVGQLSSRLGPVVFRQSLGNTGGVGAPNRWGLMQQQGRVWG
jgi:hypothetical protein